KRGIKAFSYVDIVLACGQGEKRVIVDVDKLRLARSEEVVGSAVKKTAEGISLLCDRRPDPHPLALHLNRLPVDFHAEIGDKVRTLPQRQVGHYHALRRGYLAVDDVLCGLRGSTSFPEPIYFRKIIVRFETFVLHSQGNCPCLIFANFIGSQRYPYLPHSGGK